MNNCVSIIIPIFNPGEALSKCVESVLAQSFVDIEVILINDGSTDNSDCICRKVAAVDKRIKYFPQENAGVSAARNKGIAMASGKYLCFVDSDDFVDPGYVCSMVEAIEISGADIVIQGLKQLRNGAVDKLELFDDGTFPVSSLSDKLFDDVFYFCGPYCKLFKSSIVKDVTICFPAEMSYGEDAVFYHAYLENCKVIALLSCTNYNYTVANQGALSTKTLLPDKFWQNQSRRRGAYRKLRNIFGLSPEISCREMFCKVAGVRGMLNSIFKFAADDATVARYLQLMASDAGFLLSDLRTDSFLQLMMLRLVHANNKFSRSLLKCLYR